MAFLADEDSKVMKILCLVEATVASEFSELMPDACACRFVESLDEALIELRYDRLSFSLCIVALPLYEATPVVVMEQLRHAAPDMAVVFLNENGSVTEAVDLLRAGAHHYFSRRPDTVTFGNLLSALPENLNRSVRTNCVWRQMLVGNSSAIAQVVHSIELIAERRSTVLILGETGTGKELVARAIHLASPRSARAFVAVNCAAISQGLLEAEIFGHEKGTLAGNGHLRLGKFEQAHLGSLFLDEIGDMDMDLQSKLLRVLQEREFNRVGSSETIQVDVRLIAATNADLLERVDKGKFREDLYYRLNVVPIKIPGLRDRIEDVPILVRHFVTKVCRREGLQLKVVSSECLDRLMEQSWPGNVRQLENSVEMAVVLSGHRPALLSSDFALTPTPTRSHPYAGFSGYSPPFRADCSYRNVETPGFNSGSNSGLPSRLNSGLIHALNPRSNPIRNQSDAHQFRQRTDFEVSPHHSGARLLSFTEAAPEGNISSTEVSHVPADRRSSVARNEPEDFESRPPLVSLPPEGIDFESVIGSIELSLLQQAMDRTKGNKKLAADLLGLKRTTLAAKLKTFACSVQGAEHID